jgi:hypothetical protein
MNTETQYLLEGQCPHTFQLGSINFILTTTKFL